MRESAIVSFSLAVMFSIMGPGIAQDESPADYTKKPLAKWIEALKNKENPKARIEARMALGPTGPYAKVAIPALIDALGDMDWPVGSDAAEALADYGPAIVPSLVKALKRTEAPVRAGVAEALGYVRPKATEAVPALIGAMKDLSPDVRAAAAFSLGNIGRVAYEAVPALSSALQDKNDRVREAAAGALVNMGPKSKPAVSALILALKDKEGGVRRSAAQALWRIGPDAKAAVPALIEALRNKKDADSRWTFAQALGGIGAQAKEGVPALIEAMQDRDDFLRGWAISALGEIGPGAKQAVPALMTAVKDKGNGSAIWALGKIGPDAKAAVPLLIKALAPREPNNLQFTAAEALGGIGPEAKAAIPALTAIAQNLNEDKQARKAAAEAVVKIDPELAAKLDIEAACLNVRLGKVPTIKLGPRAPLTEEQKNHIKALIRKLAEVDSPDFGMSATLTGHDFAPLPDRAHADSLVLTDHKIKSSDALRRLVEKGPDALPFLLEALEDKTPTKLKVDPKFGMMGFGEELHGNPLNPLEKRALSKPRPRDDEDDEGLLNSYTVRVGDVSFVAIGQIVGRPYQAVRYIPSAIIAINSPVQSKHLREQLRTIWSNKDSAKKLFDSLLLDYATEGKFNGKSLDGWYEGSNLQIEAAMRLLYYFPNEAAPLIAARLRSFDVRDPGEDGWMNREVKNGVRTVDFIKAVSWSSAPAIQKALDEIAKRTNEEDIKEALDHRGNKRP
jgi:HEAT repeat protein